MNGSIHGERTASGQQDRSSSVAHAIEVPSEIIRKWQEFVNLLAEIMHVPSASIMRPQCNASASGRTAQCFINPYFASAQIPAGY